MLSPVDNPQFLSQQNAHKLASKILQSYNVNLYPIPIESIVKKKGAIVKYALILSDGALARDKKCYIIKVNETLHPYRQRFTIAHELGHVLHTQLYQEFADTYQCSTGTFMDKKKEERFCDFFASYILIPDKAIVEFSDWRGISIRKLVRKAHELKVSLTPLVWRVLEQAPYKSGFIWFRMMPKPTDPNDIKLRLDWGVFPKSERIYLPRYDSVSKSSPIYQAIGSPEENLCKAVKLDFGSIRGRRNIIIKSVGQAVLAIVLPMEIDPDIILKRKKDSPLPFMGVEE
jgi:Zn-dependent peptidase ImmA (M78 family)